MFHRSWRRAAGALLCLSSSWAGDYWVATPADGGNDSNPGTQSQPFATVQRAVDALTMQGTQAAAGTITVRRGTYRETVTLKRGGTGPQARLVIRAAPGERAVLSGLEPISGWTLHQGAIYRASMPWSLDDGNTNVDADKRGLAREQVFVDGRPMIHARWPNVPVEKATAITSAELAQMDSGEGKSDSETTSSWFTDAALGSAGLSSSAIVGALISYLPGTKCFARTGRVTGYDAAQQRVTVSREELKSGNPNSGFSFTSATGSDKGGYDYLHAGCDYYLWGKLDFLDADGEWFRDPASGTLYLRFPDGGGPTGRLVEAKRRPYALCISSVNGTESADHITIEGLEIVGATIWIGKNCDDIVLRGLSVRHATHFEDARWIHYQARWPQTITLNGTNIIVEDSDFIGMVRGIEVNGRNNIVRNCVFRDIAYYGPTGFAIDARFHESIDNDGSPAQRNRVVNNSFIGSGHTAIQLQKGMDVIANEVVASHRQGNDVGAISASPSTDLMGIEVAWNRVHDLYPQPRDLRNGADGGPGSMYGAFGLYLDLDARNVIFHHNIVWGTSGPPLSFLSYSSTSNSGKRKAYHNTLVGEVAVALSNSGSSAMPIEYCNNIQRHPIAGASNIQVGGNIAYQNDDPGWIDAAAHDYRLRSTSPAIDAGIGGLTDLSGAAFHGSTGIGGTVVNAPDAGAHEGLAQRPAGAYATPAQLAQVQIAITGRTGNVCQAVVSGLPVGRRLPDDASFQIGSAAPGGVIVAHLDATSGFYRIRVQGIPVQGDGPQPIVLRSGGQTYALGTHDVSPLAIAALSGIPSGGLPMAGGATLTISGHGFARPRPQTWTQSATIANPSGQTLFNYPVRITLDSAALIAAGRLQPDGRDLRITDAEGRVLDYCYEGLGTTTTTVWVKVPHLPSTGAQLTLRYGDATLPAMADPRRVFFFYDDFADGIVDTANFVIQETGLATVSETDGAMRITPTAATTPDFGTIGSFRCAPSFAWPAGTGYILESRVTVTPTIAGTTGWKAAFGSMDNTLYVTNGQVAYWANGNQTLATSSLGSGPVTNALVGLAVNASNTQIAWYENGQRIAERAVARPTPSWHIGPNGSKQTFALAVDEVRIRPFVASEPTATLGSPVSQAPIAYELTIGGTAVPVTWINETTLTASVPPAPAGGSNPVPLLLTVNGQTVTSSVTYASFPPAPQQATVRAVHIFYNRSAWDGNDPTANARDDQAIDPDKIALRPGQRASFANYTSYSRGINGIMVDIADLPGSPLPADFACLVGNSENLQQWSSAPEPSVTLRPGAGSNGATRITLIWPDNAIQKCWLRVTVAANARTGLAQPYIFYFGNAIGECGDSPSDALVSAIDQLQARMNPRSPVNLAPLNSRWDYNRDRLVNATDVLLARVHATGPQTALRLITAP
ncbi:MAG: DUF2341 domain-containing protein [Planctomycetota bacterium]|nr:DUF2341 domain-containing protein [Planctomycetota bacterium]